MKKIKLLDTVVSAGTNERGDMLYDMIAQDIAEGNAIEVDFAGVMVLTTSFLNSSFGKLIHLHGLDYLRDKVKFVGLNHTHKFILQHYFKQFKGEYA